MKVKKWKEMLDKLNDEDDLCIAKCSQDFEVVQIQHRYPIINKRNDIHKDYYVKNINNCNNQECDYVIY